MSYDILPDHSTHDTISSPQSAANSSGDIIKEKNTDEWSHDGNGFIREATFTWLNELIDYAQTGVLMEEDALPLPSLCSARFNRVLLESV